MTKKSSVSEWQTFAGKYEENPCYIIYDEEQEIGPGFIAYDIFHSLQSTFSMPIEVKRVKRIRYISWESYFDWSEQDRREYKALQEAKAKELEYN
jgi:hypothetical protein